MGLQYDPKPFRFQRMIHEQMCWGKACVNVGALVLRVKLAKGAPTPVCTTTTARRHGIDGVHAVCLCEESRKSMRLWHKNTSTRQIAGTLSSIVDCSGLSKSCRKKKTRCAEAAALAADVTTLYPSIDIAHIWCLNESQHESGKHVIKPHSERLDSKRVLRSNAGDPELLLFVPFTVQVPIF